MNKYIVFIILIILLALYPTYFLFKKYTPNNVSQSTNTTNTIPGSSSKSNTDPSTIPPASIGKSEYNNPTFPISDFKSRITKKPFGIFITPQNSPVSPEKFTGYHIGADIEYQDVATDVPVYAIEDGTITLARTASGYGGVMVLDCSLDKERSIVYGHIRPSSLPAVGSQVKQGDRIGLLGTGYSSETDGERRHLHFAILSDNRVDITGYVQTESALSGWIDPTIIYN